MSSEPMVGAIVRSEWIKFRTVRSSIMGVVVTFILMIGLGLLVTIAIRAHWNTTSAANRLTFDPVSTSLVGSLFAQFAVGVIGVLFVTSEYSSGSIRTTLAAVPNRFQLILGKAIVLVASMFVVAEVVSFAAFLIGQAVFSGRVPTASLSDGTVLRAVLLSGVYLTLLSLLGMGLGLILRQSAASISVFTSLLLIIPIIIIFLPQSWQNSVSKFEPSELGHAMTAVATPPHDFTWPSALIVLVVYVAAVVGAGTTLLIRRDA